MTKDRFETVYRIAIRIKCIRLLFRERARLTHCRRDEHGGRDDDCIGRDANRRCEESESKSYRGRGGITSDPHGSHCPSFIGYDSGDLNSERAAWRDESPEIPRNVRSTPLLASKPLTIAEAKAGLASPNG